MTLQTYGADTAQSGGRGSPNAISPASDTQNWSQATGTATLSIVSAASLNRIQLTNDTAANVLYLGSRQFGDVDLYVRVNVSALEVRVGLLARSTDATTYYRASVQSGVLYLEVNQSGNRTTLASLNLTYSAATYYWLHFRVQGFGNSGSNPNNLHVNFWADSSSGTATTPSGEPSGWMLEASDTTLTLPGNFGLSFTPAHTSESATFDYFSCTDCPAPATLPFALLSTTVASSTTSPYGNTVFVGTTNPALDPQVILDMVGPNSASAVGWGTGSTLRYQLKWSAIEPLQGYYEWSVLDDAVQQANHAGVRFLLPLQSPPSWHQTLDGFGSNATLATSYATSSSYTTLSITALPTGAYLPHGYQITVNRGGGTAENLYLWNPGHTYTQGATTLGISTSSSAQVAWTPANNHSAGENVQEKNAGIQFVAAADFAAFATLVATRYNGLSGYGKIDLFQIENEDYDLSNRVQNQGSYNSGFTSPATWDMSSSYDNGGAILAPVYVACKQAIGAVPGHSDTPIFACAVRKTPTTGRQHIQNWISGLLYGVALANSSVDGIDTHFYAGSGRTNWDGTIVNDPTLPTYTDSTQATVNAPSISMEISDLQAVFAKYNVHPQIGVFETGWDSYDDGQGAKTTTTATYTSGTGPYTSLAVSGTWTKAKDIPDKTPITINYTDTLNYEIVYAYGATTKNSTSIAITTNPLGSGAGQTGWTPVNTQASGVTIYGEISGVPLSTTLQSSYLESMYDACRTNGATYCFAYTVNKRTSTVNSNHVPASATETKNLVQTIGGVYTYEPAYSMTAQYAAAHPTWPLVPFFGNSLYATTVLADSPSAWWRLSEPAGNTALDSSGNHNDASISGTITRGQPGAIVGEETTSTLISGPLNVDVPRLFGGTIVSGIQSGAGVLVPASVDPSAWATLTVEFWALLTGEDDWHYFAVTKSSGTILCYLDAELVPSATVQSLLGLTGTFTIAQLIGWIEAVTAATDMQELAVYSTALSALRIAAHYQAGSGFPVGNPLTVYGTNVASSTISTAGKLATGTGGTEIAVTTKIGTATGYGEITALGSSTAWPALSAIPDVPTGNGWLLDANTLYNQRILAGPWVTALTARITAGNAFADVYVRAFAYDHGEQTYTFIGMTLLSGLQLTTTKSTYVFNPADLPNFDFNGRQMLYIDAWPNVTKNMSGSTSAAIALRLSTTNGSGFANDLQVSTPGYLASNQVSTAYSAYVSGIPAFVLAGSLSIAAKIGQRSTANFTVHTAKPAYHYQQYQRVTIYDGSGALAFSGYIDQPQETKPGYTNSLTTQISCIDQHWLADKRRVNAQYTDKSISHIVHDLWKTILKAEGVKIGRIWTGTTPKKGLYPSSTLQPSSGGVEKITDATFYYCTVAEAFDELVKQASLSGTPFYWQIDQHKRLYFLPYSAITNSSIIDGTQIDGVQNAPTVTRANPTFRNTQYIVESFNNAGPFTKKITGDGQTTTWAMDYPLASAPTIRIGGKTQTVGIKGKDKAPWLWAAGDAIIAQGKGATPLGNGTNAHITYNGQYKDVAKYADSALVAAQAALDGTTGIVEDAVQNPTLAPANVALKIAKKYVQRYGVRALQLQFHTRQTGFAPGQYVKVKLGPFGISQKMLIEEVSATDQVDGYNIWYQITAIYGPYDQGASYFWKTLLKSPPAANTINVGITAGG